MIEHPKVVDAVRSGLAQHNASNPNAANRIARVLLQPTQPQPDAGEITEKGYINQNKAQTLRQTEVEHLYSDGITSRLIVL